ncbi:MAG: 2-C-methyl-D-erythritol 4-phosphate cytidylyltransferase [Candidatus Gastranaerophilales bacterium]|nr:2-C-methyl-D-erythritol 4-phosphate cytidylyltransferase [Candidatus Gastranaerophilales bacterium]
MKNYAVILASGSSNRFGGNIPKQFVKLGNETILEKSIRAFEINSNITDIIVVINPDYIDMTKDLLLNKFSKLRSIITGGSTRQESSYNGVFAIRENEGNVLIHDAARPFVTQEIINNCLEKLKDEKAVGVAIKSVDTVIKIDESGYIQEIPQRNFLRRIQTPQGFNIETIKMAHDMARQDKSLLVTDDCGMVLHFNLAKIAVINGDECNIKITNQSDIK